MGVRFVLGRAGAGKTQYCVESMRQQLRRDPRRGPTLILLVPEQASLQTERELLSTADLMGAQRGEVLSFRRFAQRMLNSNPLPDQRVLSPVGRAMVMQKLVGEHRDQLQYFQADRLLPGLYRQLSLQIEEFMACAVAPRELETGDPADVSTEMLAAKLADLRLLYEAYLGFLQGGYLDPALALEQAQKNLAGASWIRGAHIWVDGFASYSVQEMEFLIELADHSEQMEITLLIDPRADGIINDKPPDSHALFGPTVRTYHKLLEASAHRGLRIDPPQFLLLQWSANRRPPAARPADLQHLEANLFGACQKYPRAPTNLALVEAADPTEEMDRVVRKILELTSRPAEPLRYRDIAIIARQLPEQHSLIASALQQNNIPYFIDRRPPLSEHPLYYHLRALLAVAVEKLSTDSVRQLLKSDLLGLPPADADQLENYLIAHRIGGLKAWQGSDWQRDPTFRSPFDDVDQRGENTAVLEHINHTRRTLLDRIAPWIATQAGKPPHRPKGRQWAKLLYETLDNAGTPTQIEAWAVAADGDGLTAEAAHHRQAWRGVTQVFDDFAIALGGEQLTLAGFTNSFEAGLSQLDTGLVPPAVDQVIVGSIERSRHPGIRAAFVLGFNDGNYPRTHSEETMLNDDDRQRLLEAGLNIDPPRRERAADERLLAYIALTRPAEQLFISYCRNDLEGRQIEDSPYLGELRRTFPQLETSGPAAAEAPLVHRHPRECGLDLEVAAGAPAGRPSKSARRPTRGSAATKPSRRFKRVDVLDHIISAESLVTTLASRLREDNSHVVWQGLYDRARHRDEIRATLGRVLQSLIYSNSAGLSAELIDSLHRTTLRTSITALEQHAACPFKYFAAAQLRLTSRPAGEVDALFLGSLYHAVLDNFTKQLMDDGVQLHALDDEQIESRLVACIRQFNRSFTEQHADHQAAQPFLWEQLHHELLTALSAQRTIQTAGDTATIASELAFGLKQQESLPGLNLDTPKGRRVVLRGKIDRIDTVTQPQGVFGFVFDYKRSRQRLLKFSDVYHGLSLQLIVYLLAIEKLGAEPTDQKIVPGGAFYLSLIPDYETVEHPENSPPHPLKAFRPRGIFREDLLGVLDGQLTAGSSQVIAVRLNKDGTISKTLGSEAASAEDFTHLLEHVRTTVGLICDRILDGEIGVRPYRAGMVMPCSHCDYRPVCRFQFSDMTFRKLDSLNKSDVWERMRADG